MKTPMYQSTERLYLNSKGEVCSPDDLDKQSLLVPAGGTIPMADAVKYGLVKDEAAPAASKAAPKLTRKMVDEYLEEHGLVAVSNKKDADADKMQAQAPNRGPATANAPVTDKPKGHGN